MSSETNPRSTKEFFFQNSEESSENKEIAELRDQLLEESKIISLQEQEAIISPTKFEAARQEMFEQFQRDSRFYNGVEYEKIYELHKKVWGISSPAFVFPKSEFKRHPNPEILPNDIEGEVLIGFNIDSVPDPEYIDFLQEHEYSERFINHKSGFNLYNYDQISLMIPITERPRPAHSYATKKELEAAQKSGKLEKYMKWWKQFYENDIEQTKNMSQEEIDKITKNYGATSNREEIIQLIKNNWQLKVNTYHKIINKNGK